LPLLYSAIVIFTLIFVNFVILPFLFTSQRDFTSSQLVNAILPLVHGQNRGKIALNWGKIMLTCEWQGQNHKVKKNEGIITIALRSRGKNTNFSFYNEGKENVLTVCLNLSCCWSFQEEYQKTSYMRGPYNNFTYYLSKSPHASSPVKLLYRYKLKGTHNVVKLVSWSNTTLMSDSWLWPRFLNQIVT
jgi:hypothetical protein